MKLQFLLTGIRFGAQSDHLLSVPLDATRADPERTWPVDSLTQAPARHAEARCLPSITFTASGPLVYQWETYCDRIGHNPKKLKFRKWKSKELALWVCFDQLGIRR